MKIKTKSSYWTFNHKTKQVHPTDMMGWANAYKSKQSIGFRIIKQTQLANGYWVSTVFLGLDHQCYDDGPPEIFETMVFDRLEWKRGAIWGDIDIRRTSTYHLACLAHMVMCKKFYEHRTTLYGLRTLMLYAAWMIRFSRSQYAQVRRDCVYLRNKLKLNIAKMQGAIMRILAKKKDGDDAR